MTLWITNKWLSSLIFVDYLCIIISCQNENVKTKQSKENILVLNKYLKRSKKVILKIKHIMDEKQHYKKILMSQRLLATLKIVVEIPSQFLIWCGCFYGRHAAPRFFQPIPLIKPASWPDPTCLHFSFFSNYDNIIKWHLLINATILYFYLPFLSIDKLQI